MTMDLNGVKASFQTVVENPFGLDFEVHNGKPYIVFGSGLNCLGYVDQIEHIVGIARIAFGLLAFAKCEDRTHKVLSVGHVIRGLLEFMGNYEMYLLFLDVTFTVVKLARKFMFPNEDMNKVVNAASDKVENMLYDQGQGTSSSSTAK